MNSVEHPERPGAPTGADAAAENATPEAGDPRLAELEKLRAENLRLIAEQRNVATRTQRELAERLRFAEGEMARAMLSPLDDLQRALDAAPTGAESETFVAGVRVAHEHFLKALRGRSIESIESVGKPFDPELHEAIVFQPHDKVPQGTVVVEVQRGFRLHDRVLRPARVVVSSGPAAK